MSRAGGGEINTSLRGVTEKNSPIFKEQAAEPRGENFFDGFDVVL